MEYVSLAIRALGRHFYHEGILQEQREADSDLIADRCCTRSGIRVGRPNMSIKSSGRDRIQDRTRDPGIA